MSLHATFIEHTFVSILALYVTLECAVTILQTRAAEKSCGRVPEGFEKKLTLAGIRKAADYTGELAQANLLLTVVGAGFALFMTFGNGLNVFTAVIETIMGPGIPADWVLISLIVLLMLLIELPFGWWARYRVKERYGYMREPRMRWLSRTLSEALWGWLVFMPVSAALLTIFEYAGGDWWKLAWGVWLVYLLWRWKLSSVYGVFWKRRSRPYANAETREAVRESLHRQGITMTEMVVMTRPASWDHSNIVLSGWGLRRRVIVFAHVAHLLRKDEIVALAAHEAAHVRHFHGVLRLLINVAVSSSTSPSPTSSAGSRAGAPRTSSSSRVSTIRRCSRSTCPAPMRAASARSRSSSSPCFSTRSRPCSTSPHASCSTTRTCTPRASRDSTR